MPEHIRTLLTPIELEIFERVKYTTTCMIDTPNLTCHQLCHTIAGLWDSDVFQQSGYFGPQHQQHSWLRIKHNPRLIIDAYPVACLGGPILVDTGANLLIPTAWNDLYRVAYLPDSVEYAVQQEFHRASGEAICDICTKPFRRHPLATAILSWEDRPYLNQLCDGSLVKL